MPRRWLPRFANLIALHNLNGSNMLTKMIGNKLTTRRNFIKTTSLMSASLITAPSFASLLPAKYKMGLQLFSIRAPLASDVTGTIKTVASVGYEDCETYGYDPVN